MLTDYLLFTDNWWNWFLHEYAFTLVVLWALLKTLALCDPTNKTNTILDSFKSMLNNGKNFNRRATDPPKEEQIK